LYSSSNDNSAHTAVKLQPNDRVDLQNSPFLNVRKFVLIIHIHCNMAEDWEKHRGILRKCKEISRHVVNTYPANVENMVSS